MYDYKYTHPLLKVAKEKDVHKYKISTKAPHYIYTYTFKDITLQDGDINVFLKLFVSINLVVYCYSSVVNLTGLWTADTQEFEIHLGLLYILTELNWATLIDCF